MKLNNYLINYMIDVDAIRPVMPLTVALRFTYKLQKYIFEVVNDCDVLY